MKALKVIEIFAYVVIIFIAIAFLTACQTTKSCVDKCLVSLGKDEELVCVDLCTDEDD